MKTAISLYEKALELDTNQAFFIECDYGKSLREREKALEHLGIALCLNPLSGETQFFKAYCHYMIEDFHESLELLNICLRANDYARFGRLFLNEGHWNGQQIISAFRRTLSIILGFNLLFIFMLQNNNTYFNYLPCFAMYFVIYLSHG